GGPRGRRRSPGSRPWRAKRAADLAGGLAHEVGRHRHAAELRSGERQQRPRDPRDPRRDGRGREREAVALAADDDVARARAAEMRLALVVERLDGDVQLRLNALQRERDEDAALARRVRRRARGAGHHDRGARFAHVGAGEHDLRGCVAADEARRAAPQPHTSRWSFSFSVSNPRCFLMRCATRTDATVAVTTDSTASPPNMSIASTTRPAGVAGTTSPYPGRRHGDDGTPERVADAVDPAALAALDGGLQCRAGEQDPERDERDPREVSRRRRVHASATTREVWPKERALGVPRRAPAALLADDHRARAGREPHGHAILR